MRVGVFGLGFMGATHLRAWRRVAGAEVVAVVCDEVRALGGDLSEVRGNFGEAGERMDFSKLARYADSLDALRDPAIEAVDLCLPTHLHAGVTIAALEEGKHVLVEKPMALTAVQCARMIDAARASGRILMVGQILRFMPAYVTAARMVESGELGTVRSAVFRRRTGVPAWGRWLTQVELSGGAVLDMLVHDIDFAMHLFGRPEAVSATGYAASAAPGLDCATATLDYAGAPSVTITGGWYPGRFPFSMEFTIAGDCGTLEFSSELHLYPMAGEGRTLELPAGDPFEAELAYFTKCVAAGKEPDRCPPAASAAAVTVAGLIAESRSRRGERISCRF